MRCRHDYSRKDANIAARCDVAVKRLSGIRHRALESVMTISFRRRPNSLKQSPPKQTAEAIQIKPDTIELGPQHLDYDLQPLNVDGLAHYIEPDVDDERFRVH
jgi:hypothetical protein